MTMKSILFAGRFALVVGFVAALSSGCPGSDKIIDLPPVDFICENNDECGAGNLCIGGTCLIAQCDPTIEGQCGVDAVEDRDPTCCRVFENCNPITFKCARDQNAEGIGCPDTEPDCIACVESPDCFAELTFASFCSGGRCFATAGRTSCSQDFQCAEGERCDRTEFFCVADAGGCRFCGPDFPELCCANGQACDQAANVCIDLGAANECTVETVLDDCRASELCDGVGRCVQCIEDDNCGPGTNCEVLSGLCVSDSRCESDDPCLALSPLLRCIENACDRPDCEVNSDCDDPRERCEAFTCVLPAAVCTETDEPNNNSDQAVALDDLASAYAGVLCRGDFDFISFPVQPSKRYTATVTAASTPFAGITVTMFDTTNVQESNQVFLSSPSSVVLVGVTGAAETGRFSVQVSSSSAIERDSWSYTVTLREEDASAAADCAAAAQVGQEPNESAATAVELVLGATTSFTRCSATDIDFFRVAVPELNGLVVTVDGFQNAEGNLAAELFRGPAPGVSVERQQTTANLETVDSPEGATEFFIKVNLPAAGGALANQIYRVTTTARPRPAVCAADVGENDGATATAQALTTTTTAGLVSASRALIRCNAQDVDHVSFTVPPNLGGTLRLAFTQSEGDLALDLIDAATGTQVATSNVSSSTSGSEAIDLPQDAGSRNYLAKVRLASTVSSAVEGQIYTLSLSTFDAGACLDTEPIGDGTFQTAHCLDAVVAGAFACNGAPLVAPVVSSLSDCSVDESADGCGRTCGNGDSDVTRIGTLESGRTITASLSFDPTLGDLALQLAKVTISGSTATPSVALTRKDTDLATSRDGLVEMVFDIPVGTAKEHMLTVKPEGTAGHEAQPYALSIQVSAACIADQNEANGGNSTPGTSTLLRAEPALAQDDDVIAASVCNADVDVYEILAFANEEITLRYNGPAGVRMRAGTRPANLTETATTLAGADVTVDATGLGTLTVTSNRVQQLFFTLDRVASAGVGNYDLIIDYTAAP